MYNEWRARHARLVRRYNKFNQSEQNRSDAIREAADIQLAEMLARAAARSREESKESKKALCFSRFEKMHTDLYINQSLYYHTKKTEHFNNIHSAYV